MRCDKGGENDLVCRPGMQGWYAGGRVRESRTVRRRDACFLLRCSAGLQEMEEERREMG